jgi:dephospho-CoA kinase
MLPVYHSGRSQEVRLGFILSYADYKRRRHLFGILGGMKHHENVKIVAFVGLAGSGKSVAVDYLTNKGYPKVYFGGVVLDAMTAAGLEHTQENEKPFREELRAREGKDFVVNRIVSQIRDLVAAGQHRIVADGIYSWTEYKVMKREFPGELTTVAIVAPKHLRHHRLSHRPIRPLTEAEANQRDWAEIENLEKGGPIAIADHYIINDSTPESMYQQIDAELRHVEF